MRNSQADFGHRTVAYVRRQFGEHLCTFLLAGRGEDEAAWRRSFAVAEPGEGGIARERYVEAVADGRGTLPHGGDPLVLGAVFKLFLEAGETGNVMFRLSELFRLLPPDGAWHWEAVDAALWRYFNTSYREVLKTGHGATGSGHPAVIRASRLITGYDYEQSPDGGGDGQTYIDIIFNVDFIEQLKRGALFGIDWKRVASLTRLPSESG
ncbi:MAG: hypothetical protein M3416_03010 [Acidobacteriota bacterium]|nr:hypothetical protein [Acidobacteriota bacterium]